MKQNITLRNPIKKVIQKENYCGPATLEMLISYLGEETDQLRIAQICNITNTIDKFGSRIDQLDQAVKLLLPNHSIFWKRYATLDDIEYILHKLQLPLVVEWQARFIFSDGSYYDEGHYSIVIGINRTKGVIKFIETSNNSYYKSGIIEISEFLERWWDVNIVYLPEEKITYSIIDNRLLFLIAPDNSCELLNSHNFVGCQDYLQTAFHIS
jgi:hypothetical protein